MQTESHPLRPFIPPVARVLLLGSFPPPRARWCIDFFYPNYINDMWRVMGVVFFHDKLHFVDESRRTFRLDLIVPFLETKGIALYDTATQVCRLKDNASDKFLEITQPTDVATLVKPMQMLQAIVTTGQKATDTLLEALRPLCGSIDPPAVGDCTPFLLHGRQLRFYRMPSTSRAYPLSLEKKAEKYAAMFCSLGLLAETPLNQYF